MLSYFFGSTPAAKIELAGQSVNFVNGQGIKIIELDSVGRDNQLDTQSTHQSDNQHIEDKINRVAELSEIAILKQQIEKLTEQLNILTLKFNQLNAQNMPNKAIDLSDLRDKVSKVSEVSDVSDKVDNQVSKVSDLHDVSDKVNKVSDKVDGEEKTMLSKPYPTYTALVSEFGLFDSESTYTRLMQANDTAALERFYYFEYLKRFNAIREETLRTIKDIYGVEDPHVIDCWIAQNPMIPSHYFKDRPEIFYLLSKHCMDVDFIEANLNQMDADGLRENRSLKLAFFAKHKINIGPPQIFLHDVSQEYCDRAYPTMTIEDFIRLSTNDQAPVAFMTQHADRVHWELASQFGSAKLLYANHERIIKPAMDLNLNLISTPPCDFTLADSLDDPYARFINTNNEYAVANYNCDWRKKLLISPDGAFSDWKKYLFE